MSTSVLVIGASGSGKSTALRNLNPEETFIISVLGKPLPFKGGRSAYKQEKGGNYYVTDSADNILKAIVSVDANKKFKNLVIDDWQYVLANSFMRRAKEKGYEKFTDIGRDGWLIIKAACECRDDLKIFVIAHNEIDEKGNSKVKTIGKMLDDKITIEGMFTIVLHTWVEDGKYKFITQTDGHKIAKSPMGMFSESLIDNDLLEVSKAIDAYYDEANVSIVKDVKQHEPQVKLELQED